LNDTWLFSDAATTLYVMFVGVS